jgi:hypothetical protein
MKIRSYFSLWETPGLPWSKLRRPSQSAANAPFLLNAWNTQFAKTKTLVFGVV